MDQEISSYSKRVDQIVSELQTDLKRGLGEVEAAARRKKQGPNRIAGKDRISALKLFIKQYKDFMILILACAAVISFLIGDTKDAVAIGIVLIANGLISFIQEFKAERTLQALKGMAGPVARVIHDGVERKISAARLARGDIVILEQGDIVPADCRLFEINILEIQESALNGECDPVEKGAQVILSKRVPLGDQRNMTFMGTMVTQGRGRGIVTEIGMDTEVGKIAHLISEVKDRPTPLQIKLHKLGKRLVMAAFLLCAAVFFTGILRGYPIQQMILVTISLGVAVVPEGLPAVVTIALAIGVQKMSKRHAIVRHLPAVETLGSVTMIGSDKTGTLTEGKMRARCVWYADGERSVEQAALCPPDIFRDSQFFDPFCEPANPLGCLLAVSLLCNNASLRCGKEGNEESFEVLGDPTEGALLRMGHDLRIPLERLQGEYTFLTELPFDARRKTMSKIVETPDDRILVFTKGAADRLLELSSHFKTKDGDVTLTDQHKKTILDAMAKMGAAGFRVLGMACRSLSGLGLDVEPEDIEMGLTFIGLVGMEDSPRPEVKEAVAQCQAAGIRTIMITGDHLRTAVAVGQAIGLLRRLPEAVTGEDVERMDDATLRRKILDYRVFARVAPEHKLRIVKFLRERGEVIAMTGDGVNDAPALKASNVGIAMGRTGTDVTKEAADIVLTDDNFSTIVAAVEEGRTIYDNIRKFIGYLLSCNAAEILLMFLALAFGLPMPLSPIQILWLNLVTDTPPALALGADPAQPDVMRRRPRDPKESLFSGGLFYRVALEGLLMAVLTLLLFVVALYWKHEELSKARTMVFAGLAMLQLVHAFNSQSERFSLFRMASYFNKHLVAAFLFSVSLLVLGIYAPYCRSWFHHIPLGLADWLAILGASAVLVLFVETAKRGFSQERGA